MQRLGIGLTLLGLVFGLAGCRTISVNLRRPGSGFANR